MAVIFFLISGNCTSSSLTILEVEHVLEGGPLSSGREPWNSMQIWRNLIGDHPAPGLDGPENMFAQVLA